MADENFLVNMISAQTGLCPRASNEQEGEQFMEGVQSALTIITGL